MGISNIMACFAVLSGNIIKVTPKFCEMLGYSEKELLSLHFKDITHPAYINDDLNMFQGLIEKKIDSYEMEKQYITKDGSTVWVYLACSLVIDHEKNLLYILAYVKNIDQQKKLEIDLEDKSRKIQQYQERISIAEETAEVITGIVTLDGSVQEINNVFYQKLGYTKEEWTEKRTFYEITHPADWEKEKELVRQLRKGNIKSYKIEKRVKHKKGAYIWFYVVGSLMRDSDGIPSNIWIHAYEISHRKNLEEQLMKSYREYQKLIDFFPEAIYITKDMKYLYMNEKGKKVLGMDSNEQYKGKSYFDFLHPDYLEQFEEMKSALETNKVIPFTQHRNVRKDGTMIEVESTSSLIIYHQQEAVLTITRDVTESKKTALYLKQLNEQMKLYIEEKDHLIMELRKFRHNYLNIMYGMSGYIEEVDSVELKYYFYSIVQELEKLKSSNTLSIQKIKNHAIRGLLTAKVCETQKKDIDLQIYVENDIIISEQLIEEKDLCQIIGIYLDEAINEAKDTPKKRVLFGIFDDTEYTCMFVENSYGQQQYFDSEGMVFANMIASKYKHILQNTFIENNQFVRELHIQKSTQSDL